MQSKPSSSSFSILQILHFHFRNERMCCWIILLGMLLIAAASSSTSIPTTRNNRGSIGTGTTTTIKSIAFLQHGIAIHDLRAGHQSKDDNEDDEDDYEEYEEEFEDGSEEESDQDDQHQHENYDHHLVEPPPSSLRREQQQQQQQQRSPYRSGRKKKKNQKHWTQKMVEGSVKLTGDVAWNTMRQSGKLAYHMIRPKHVEEKEINGMWRLDQQIIEKRGGRSGEERILSSVATIQIDSRRHIIVVQQQQQPQHQKEEDEDGQGPLSPWIQPYQFLSTRLGLYQTIFVARAFLVGQEQVRIYGYKGTWERKVADSNVLKLVGKIYKVRKLRRRPSGGGKSSKGIVGGYELVGKSIGTFVARRRVQIDEEEEEEEDYDDDDEYDGEYSDGGYDDEDDVEQEDDDINKEKEL